MPLYEYRCETCEGRFEVLQGVRAGAEGVVCPTCGAGRVTRQFSTFAAATGAGASCASTSRFT